MPFFQFYEVEEMHPCSLQGDFWRTFSLEECDYDVDVEEGYDYDVY